MENKLSQSLEDYLEIIYTGFEQNKKIKAIDISRKLSVSRASVTEALKKLAGRGYINYEKYGNIIITEQGIEKAEKIVFLHRELTSFFKNLGVADGEAEDIACKIEHIISSGVKEKVVAFNDYCKNHPGFDLTNC